jgi:tetratricopeptide (TPR) repeat protein/predicted Ser/Thr protein kinase
MSELAPGQALESRFELLRLLGRGGMGQVWLALDRELQERVAVKVLDDSLAADDSMVELLRHECRQARRLIHPNIVRIFDFHKSEDHAFISMEFVEGGELGQLRDDRPEEILAKVVPLTAALGYAHAQGIVHRDLKPSNVLIDREGRPRLVDFGIAGLLRGGGEMRISGGGSPLSMSPQQRAGMPPSPADDTFALGVLIYELVSGFPPSVDEEQPPPEPIRSRMNYAVPRRLQKLVSRLLVADAAWRLTDTEEIGRELEAALQECRNRTLPPQATVVAEGGDDVGAVPVSPVPRASVSGVPDPEHRPKSMAIVWGAFALLALALVGVIFVLPGVVERDNGDEAATAVEAPAAPTEDELEKLAAAKADADAAAGRFGELKTALIDREVEAWGKADFADALLLADTADKAAESAQYATALETWRQAIGALEALDARSRELLDAALKRGASALAEGRGIDAATAFNTALAHDPENETAMHGLARAANIERVFELLEEGRRLEEEGRLDEARERFVEVSLLDAEVAGPREAIARIDAALLARSYTGAMSRAYALLSAARYEEAISAFREAARIRPGEAAEGWRQALEIYQAILAKDPSIVFAQQGSRRAGSRAALDARLEGLLADPERLYSEQVQASARAALADANTVDNPGPRLQQQTSRLVTLIQEAMVPVLVKLESDNETEITLFRVGRLGTFDRYELELRPGTYTIVGTRRGFRDVRQQFTIRPGAPAGPFSIRCEEPI